MTDVSTIAPGAGGPIVRDADELLDALARRKDELGLSNECLESLGGFCAGHVDKMLGPTRARMPNLATLDVLTELLAVSFVIVEDPEKKRRVSDRWERRDEAQVRRCIRVSMRLIEACRPTVLRELTSKAGKARMTKMTAAARKRIARLAATARWARSKRRKAA